MKQTEMKELRLDGVWRAEFAFNPKHNAIFFVVADQSDGSEMKFYTRLIKTVDERFDRHADALK